MKKLKKKDLFPHLYFNNKCTKINITTDNELNCQKVSPRLVYSCVHPGIQDTTEVIWILRKKITLTFDNKFKSAQTARLTKFSA